MALFDHVALSLSARAWRFLLLRVSHPSIATFLDRNLTTCFA
jgi:hypothetical protein